MITMVCSTFAVLAIMMVKRPEGLFPVESAKAEMHGIGLAAEVTGVSADELAVVEEVVAEGGIAQAEEPAAADAASPEDVR